jgi:hypothetical protein
MTGAGGAFIETVRTCPPRIPPRRDRLNLADERQKRHGQAVAAASLPELR